jgi:hypothetical protein
MYFTTIFFLQLFHLFHNSLSLLESLWQREKKCGILFKKQEMRIWFQKMGFTLRIARFLKPLVQSVNQGSSHSIVVWNFLREQAEMAIRCSVERLEHAPETMGRMLGLSSQRSRFHLEPKWYM